MIEELTEGDVAAEMAAMRRSREDMNRMFRNIETTERRKEREKDESEAVWYANMRHERPTSAWPIANAEAWFRQEVKAEQAAVQARLDAQSDRVCAIRRLQQTRKDAEEQKRLAEERKVRPLQVTRPAGAKGPPCPFADIVEAELTADQRYSVLHWDDPSSGWRERARGYAVQALAPGELLQEAIDDIRQFCRYSLTHDDFATMHVIELLDLYRAWPDAKPTEDASDKAATRAFLAAGLVPHPKHPNEFCVREAADELGFQSGDELEEEEEGLVPGLIPARCQVCFVGSEGSGKSTEAAHLLAAVAHGKEWLGRPTVRAQCAYINFDGRDADVRRLLKKAGDDGKVAISSFPDHDLTDPAFWKGIGKRYGNGHPALIVIDSLSRGSRDVNENDSRFAQPVHEATKLSHRYPITFVWIHHTPGVIKGNTVNDWLRGTKALGPALDVVVTFARVSSAVSPRETVFKVTFLRERADGLAPRPPFKRRLTDDGFELYDGKAKAAPADEDDEKAILAGIVANPGTNVDGLASALHMRPADIRKVRDKLLKSGRARVEGKGRATKLFAS